MSVPMDQMDPAMSALQAPPAPEQGAPMEDAGLDYEVAVGLMDRLIYQEESMDSIIEAISKGDFVEASAMMIASMAVQVREQMLAKDLVEDERIWAAEGGVMHTIADEFVEIGQQAGIEAAFDEGVDNAIFDKAIQQLEMSQGGGQQALPPEQAAPAPMSALGV